MFGFGAAESENIARLNQFYRGELMVLRSDIFKERNVLKNSGHLIGLEKMNVEGCNDRTFRAL